MSKNLDTDVITNNCEIDESGCWIWKGKIDEGRAVLQKYPVKIYAHRYAYQAFVGEIPEGKFVHRTCGSNLCCNPEHLVLADEIGGGFGSSVPVRVGHYDYPNKTAARKEVGLSLRTLNLYLDENNVFQMEKFLENSRRISKKTRLFLEGL